MKSKYLITLLLVGSFCVKTMAQNGLLTKEELEKAPWFYDLESANETPLEVYNLSLTWEKKQEFPSEIFTYSNLQYLDLMDNEIREISTEITKLEHLQILFLSNNKISKLPEALKKMKHLEVLHLERNRLDQIPDWIGELPSLKKVGLRDNKLSAETIAKLNEKYPTIEFTK